MTHYKRYTSGRCNIGSDLDRLAGFGNTSMLYGSGATQYALQNSLYSRRGPFVAITYRDIQQFGASNGLSRFRWSASGTARLQL